MKKKQVQLHKKMSNTDFPRDFPRVILAEQHRNTRHDAIEQVMSILIDHVGKPLTEEMINECESVIMNLKQRVPDTSNVSEVLTFDKLDIGDHFIDFPVDGDNQGHGGFLKGSYVFKKTEKSSAIRLVDYNSSTFPDSMEVLLVIIK